MLHDGPRSLAHLWRRDIAPEGASLAESNAMLDKVVELAEHLQQETGKRVLWGTAQLFKHPRFMHGAATSAPACRLLPVFAIARSVV